MEDIARIEKYKVTSEVGEVDAPAASANEEASGDLTEDILLAVLCTCCYVN